jgi:DNA-binding transcriptional regulator YbjK
MRHQVNSKRQNPRRQDILEAALRTIGRRGVDGVTHRAVAEEAEVPLAATTYYFDSKYALVEEAFELIIDRSIECLRRYTTTSSNISRSELIDRIVGFADAQMRDPDAVLTAQFELMLEAGRTEYLRPLAHRWNIAYMDGITELVRSARVPRAEAASELISKFVEGALLGHATTPNDYLLNEYIRPLLTDLVTAWCRTYARGRRTGGLPGAAAQSKSASDAGETRTRRPPRRPRAI